jgi:predicted RND superfamily exporter protein
MGDYPAEMADVVTYDLQLKQTQMHINELNNNILLQLNPNGLTVEEQAEEHRDYIHDSINEHADEEDYKLDTPSEIEVEYAVQLKNQDNQMVQL